MPPAKPRQFLLNSSVEPSSPNFLPGTPHFYYTHSIRRRFVSILRITLGKNHIFCLCQKSSVTQKYVKNAFPVGAHTPDPAGGAHDAPPESYLAVEGTPHRCSLENYQ